MQQWSINVGKNASKTDNEFPGERCVNEFRKYESNRLEDRRESIVSYLVGVGNSLLM